MIKFFLNFLVCGILLTRLSYTSDFQDSGTLQYSLSEYKEYRVSTSSLHGNRELEVIDKTGTNLFKIVFDKKLSEEYEDNPPVFKILYHNSNSNQPQELLQISNSKDFTRRKIQPSSFNLVGSLKIEISQTKDKWFKIKEHHGTNIYTSDISTYYIDPENPKYIFSYKPDKNFFTEENVNKVIDDPNFMKALEQGTRFKHICYNRYGIFFYTHNVETRTVDSSNTSELSEDKDSDESSDLSENLQKFYYLEPQNKKLVEINLSSSGNISTPKSWGEYRDGGTVFAINHDEPQVHFFYNYNQKIVDNKKTYSGYNETVPTYYLNHEKAKGIDKEKIDELNEKIELMKLKRDKNLLD